MQPIEQIAANGLTFAYLEAGEGPLVLCLHGFPDTPHTFDDLLPRLAAAGYHAVAPFLRGYPPTSIPVDGNCSEVRLGHDVLALIEAFGADAALVVAHDWGALAAHTAVSLDASRIRKLVTIANPHPQAIRPDLGFLRHSWHFFAFGLPGVDALLSPDGHAGIDWVTRRWSPSWRFTADDLAHAKAVFAQRGALDAALGYYRSLAAGATFGFFTEEARLARALRAKKTHVPTLALYGSEDGALDPSTWKRTASAYAGPYEQICFEGVGHFLHREAKDRFAAEVLRFLAPQRL